MYNTYEDYVASGEFDDGQLEEIYIGFSDRLPLNAIKMYAQPEFDKYQMDTLRRGFTLHHCPRRLMTYVANPELDSSQMSELIAAINHNVPAEVLELATNPAFDRDQMRQIIIAGCDPDISIDNVRIFATPEFNFDQMYCARTALEDMVISDEDFKEYTKPEYPAPMLRTLYLALERDELTAAIPKFLELCNTHYVENFTQERFGYLLGFIAGGVPDDAIEYLFFSNQFSQNQLYEIYFGLHGGLSWDQVKTYASPKIPAYEMKEIRGELLEG